MSYAAAYLLRQSAVLPQLLLLFGYTSFILCFVKVFREGLGLRPAVLSVLLSKVLPTLVERREQVKAMRPDRGRAPGRGTQAQVSALSGGVTDAAVSPAQCVAYRSGSIFRGECWYLAEHVSRSDGGAAGSLSFRSLGCREEGKKERTDVAAG